jgi:CPA2 family monovalent cation:H+ antiporter-2
VIGGFGRVGRLIARALEAENVPYVALDTNGELVARMRLEHKMVYFGDAGRSELLDRVGARRAFAFVVTINNARAAERMVAAAKQINPRAVVLARASDPAHAERLIALGAVSVIPETVEASLQLVARLLERLDLPEEAISQRVADMRAAELGRLTEGAAGGERAN